MMLKKRVVSIVMVIAVLLTLTVIPSTFSAENTEVADTAAAADYNLTGNIRTGNILHAFNWRMSDLVKYAPEIAAAGYSTVQISPIQHTKATANDGSYATDWWSFYQPTDMKIGNALGTEADLRAATTELHKYGIKVIADVVTNHVQNCESKADAANVASILSSTTTGARHSLTQHPMKADDSSRKNQVQGDMDNQLPDLNTGSKTYQNYLIENLLNPLCDAGVDGFRFDAAKHIETPDDGAVASDYWPTVTNAIKAKNSNAFIYGEVLANAGRFNISSYTKYMSVTDYAYGDTVRSALSSKNASGLVNYGYSGSAKNQNVLWLESHDNFCSEISTGLTKKQQILGWAVVGSRADAPALFYVRPKHEALDSPGFIKYDDLMGAPGSADTWKDPTVVAVNHFKNAFAGQNESVSASGSNLFVQRGTSGMVIVNLNGSSTSISQSCTLASGSYTDQVSGKTFQVSGGKITGNVGSTGVAVIYNKTASNSCPTVSLKLDGVTQTPETLSRYTAATATIDVIVDNATEASVKVSNLPAVAIDKTGTTFKLNSSIAKGKSVDITITAKNGAKTVTRTYNIKKKDANETKRVFFDNSVMKWPAVYVFCKTGVAPKTKISAYDAYQMQPYNGSETLLYYDVPANTNYVKFNEGYIDSIYTDKQHTDKYGRCHLFHSFSECQGYCGRTMPETVVNYGTANNASNRENGGYQLTGSMILQNLRFEDYGNYPVATLSASDTTLGGSTAPTQPTQPQPTQPQPTQPQPTQPQPTQNQPTEPYSTAQLRGDADADGEVTIFDVTRIQRKLVGLDVIDELHIPCADVDGNGDVEIIDATYIQRYLAGMYDPYNINKIIGQEDVDPTDPVNPDPTEAQEMPDLKPLKNDFVAGIYCEAFSEDTTMRTKEEKFNKSTATLTYNFPGSAYVFVRNYDTGVEYCTDGWTNFANPVTLVNYNTMKANGRAEYFEKLYVPAGTQTLYLIDNGDDTFTFGYISGGVVPSTNPGDPNPTTTVNPSTGDDDILFIPGDGSVDNPAWFAWVWNDGSEGQWIRGEESGDNIIFPGAAAYSNMLVARMPSGATTGDWNVCWNQSEDISIQSGTLAFKSWGTGNKFLIEWR